MEKEARIYIRPGRKIISIAMPYYIDKCFSGGDRRYPDFSMKLSLDGYTTVSGNREPVDVFVDNRGLMRALIAITRGLKQARINYRLIRHAADCKHGKFEA